MPHLGVLIGLCALFGLAIVIVRRPDAPSRSPLRDNVPVVSWILLRGRCRHCHSPISWQYPFVELATADGLLTHEHPLGNRETYGYSREGARRPLRTTTAAP